MSEGPPSLWRTIRSTIATEEDFTSHRALGRPQRNATIEEWVGVSTFDDPARAAKLARQWGQGDYLARLDLDPDGPIRWAKTRGPGHYTIWGEPAAMIARIVEIVPVAAGGQQP